MVGLQIFLLVAALYFFRKVIWKIIWHTVRFFLWRPKALMVLLVAFLCWNTYGIWNAPDAPDMVPPPPPAPENIMPEPQPKSAQARRRASLSPLSYPSELPPLPSKPSNGNSRFAADLLSKMGHNELQWYSRVFYHALQTLPAGETHQWLYAFRDQQMFGTITPGAIEKEESGIVCRTFAELLVVNKQAQRLNGVACQRVGGGWCKLRAGSVHTCEISTPSGIGGWWYGIKRSLRGLF
ncbi:MAG: hypothetical protein K2Q12_01820 [Rickettsiales bacterium]|nr:hypothetical protein [Rickettsiales bacterium]